MTDLDRVIDLLVKIVQCSDDKKTLGAFIVEHFEVENHTDFIMGLPSLLNEALEAMSSLDFEGSNTSFQILLQTKRQLFTSLRSQNVSEFKSSLRIQERLNYLYLIKNSLQAAQIRQQEPLRRDNLASDLQALLGSVRSADIPEYAKIVLDMKIRSLITICSFPEHYSDQELRLRIKSVFADLEAEFSQNDKKYQDLRETVLRLVKSYGGYGLLALSLGADVTAVAGLLSAPPKALPPP
ncbi:MAG: hypothetical protein AAF160_12605 [Pseudomonadota bacterium]